MPTQMHSRIVLNETLGRELACSDNAISYSNGLFTDIRCFVHT